MNPLLIAYLVMAAAIVGVVALTRRGKGIGVRVVQLVTVALVVPALLILRVQDRVSSDSVMTVLGALVGYVLSNIKDFKPKGTSAPSSATEPRKG